MRGKKEREREERKKVREREKERKREKERERERKKERKRERERERERGGRKGLCMCACMIKKPGVEIFIGESGTMRTMANTSSSLLTLGEWRHRNLFLHALSNRVGDACARIRGLIFAGT